MGPIRAVGIVERRPRQDGPPPQPKNTCALRAHWLTAQTIHPRDIPPALHEQSQHLVGPAKVNTKAFIVVH